MTIDDVTAQVESLFDPAVPFKKSGLGNKVVYMRDFPAKELQIIVSSPIRTGGRGVSYELVSRLPVEFAVYHRDIKCLEFRDSQIKTGWLDVARQKVETLVQLCEGAELCPHCDVYTHPIEDSAPQGKPRSTHFVWYKCHLCSRKTETQWGTGLKTAVSMFLKKK